MSREKSFDKNVAKRTLSYFWREVKREKKYFLPLAFVIPASVFLVNFANPWIMSGVINELQTNPPHTTAEIFAKFGPDILLYVGAMILGEIILWRLLMFLGWKGEVRAMRRLREKAFAKLSAQSMTFHNDRFGGSMVSQLNRFSSAFENLGDTIIWGIFPMVVSFVFTFAILTPLLPWFSLAIFVISVIFMLVAFFSFAKIRHISERAAAAQSKLSGFLSDAVANISAVKAFGREKFEMKLFREKNDENLRVDLENMRAQLKRDVKFGSIIAALAIATFIFLVGGNVWFGAQIGTLFLAVSYMSNIWGQLWQFSRILKTVNKVFGDAQEMTEILDSPVEVKDLPDAPELEVRGGEIDFRNITFWHHDTKEKDAIFREFSLQIPAGQKVGLVGHSGGGKTTLTKLLLRFSDVQKGEILIDGQNIREITQKSLHRSIAYVPQEPMLFHRTIRENIAYAKPDASDAEIREAAKKANALDFIEKLPEKFDTMTGERGVKLSGGQRQRIAIARAILADAPILVLDEATSALDTESEKLIQDALKNLMENRTSLIIAHRLSTVANLDRILVMENGKIAEDDTHKNLISRKNSIYAKLWNQQTGAANE